MTHYLFFKERNLIKRSISIHLLFLVLAVFIIPACSSDEKDDMDGGEIDFSVYVSLGNSLTAGYTDGDLFKSGQLGSYPNILADQFNQLDGGEFIQPLMFDEFGLGNRIVLSMEENCLGVDSLSIVSIDGSPNSDNTLNIYEDQGPFHNMGVPGAMVSHLLVPGYGMLNPYFKRFASNPSNSSVIADAVRLDPGFFTLWIGNNDVLFYATSGGTSPAPVTSPNDFRFAYNLVLSNMTQKTSYGAIANIPDITAIPYFTTIQAEGKWAKDASAGNQVRQLTADEFVLLPAFTEIQCEDLGSENHPLPEKYFLSQSQVQTVRETIQAYNAIIAEKAEQYDLALVDMHALLETAVQGITYDGLVFTTEFVLGGIFALDGVHLSARGNAIVANTFIHSINQQYGTQIPIVSVTQYPGIDFP